MILKQYATDLEMAEFLFCVYRISLPTCIAHFPLITSITTSQTYPVDIGTLIYVTTVSTCFITAITKRTFATLY